MNLNFIFHLIRLVRDHIHPGNARGEVSKVLDEDRESFAIKYFRQLYVRVYYEKQPLSDLAIMIYLNNKKALSLQMELAIILLGKCRLQ